MQKKKEKKKITIAEYNAMNVDKFEYVLNFKIK